jgi:hypothetical protein
MAIRKQNRALLIFVAIVLVVLGFVLFREGKLGLPEEKANQTPEIMPTAPTLLQPSDDGATPAAASEEKRDQPSEKQQAFTQIIHDLGDCLGSKMSVSGDLNSISLETLLAQLEPSLGTVAHQTDKWVDWHLRTQEGDEKRLRLEISENDDGSIRKELHYYAVGRDDKMVAVELDPADATNPSDETLNEMLRQGEVFLKERSGSVVFMNGERLDYVQKNGELSEIEIVRDEKIFQCQSLSRREECQCVK